MPIEPRLLAPLAGALLLVSLSGCVTTAEQGRRMQHTIDGHSVRLKAIEASLEEQQRQLAVSTARLDARLQEIDGALKKLGIDARRKDADFGVNVDRLIAETQALKGQIEEQRHALAQQQAQIEALQAQLAGAAAPVPRTEAAPPAAPLDGPGALKAALAHLEAKRYAEARAAAEASLKANPESAEAPELRFLVADAWYQEGAWRPAIMEFNRFREAHKGHEKGADALYRIGDAFSKIDLKPEAGKFFKAVIRKYPKSEAARQAKARLAGKK